MGQILSIGLILEATTGGVLLKKAALKNFANFTGNTCVGVSFDKVAGL